MEREARHAWSRRLTRLRTLKGVRGNSSQPFRLRRLAKANQGLRSFHSLDPWLLSVHPSGVLIHALMPVQFEFSNLEPPMQDFPISNSP